jgi:branched-chain amino acid aminotransferase
MDPELACIDGQLVPLAQATISVTDHGLVRGDGVFEAFRLYGGRPYALDAHLARLERSAAGLRLPLDIAAVRADIEALLAAREAGDGIVRVMLTRGGRRITLVEKMPAVPVTVALAPVTYAPSRLLDGVKSLSYAANMLASRIARDDGADDALLVTPHGRVLECPTASFFIVVGAEVCTAPLSEHILDSITRRAVLAAAAVTEAPIAIDALAGADEAFVASTGYEVAGVHRVGDVRYDAPGPRTSEIAALGRERLRAEQER